MNIIDRPCIHGQWSSRWTFILAATGSAVGLGNIWKFPYITGQNGGSAFVFVYLMCVVALGIPLMMAEILLGRRGRSTPIHSMRKLTAETKGGDWWQIIGWSGTVAGVLILSYYSVIGGWTLAYIFKSAVGTFSGASGPLAASTFAGFVGNPATLFIWHSLFMAITMVVVAGGVKGGLEKAVQFLMPILVILLVIMVGYSTTTGFFFKGIAYLFTPDFAKLSGASMLSAMGHAFFTLGLGMGTIMIYGAYVPPGTSIAHTSVMIALIDTVVALLAGMAIFPIVFANHLEPGSGPGLIFQTLPVAFGNMTAGVTFGTLFFILLLVAAWTSSIALLEPAATWLIETFGMSRKTAVLWSGGVTWLLGLGTVFSFNIWQHLTVFGLTYFDLLDFITSNLMLPLGGILIALFAGWLMKSDITREELHLQNPAVYRTWQALVRYVAPVAVFIVLFFALEGTS